MFSAVYHEERCGHGRQLDEQYSDERNMTNDKTLMAESLSLGFTQRKNIGIYFDAWEYCQCPGFAFF